MAATGVVRSPTTTSRPPKNSSTPASPMSENNSAVPPDSPMPPNQPKSFCAPCCMNNKTDQNTGKRMGEIPDGATGGRIEKTRHLFREIG